MNYFFCIFSISFFLAFYINVPVIWGFNTKTTSKTNYKTNKNIQTSKIN